MRFFLYVRVDVGLLRYRMGWEFSCEFFFFLDSLDPQLPFQ
jgi:hypothetical protein